MVTFPFQARIRKITVGAPAKAMPGSWGSRYLQGSTVQFIDSTNHFSSWRELTTLRQVKDDGFVYIAADMKATKLRLIFRSNSICYLGVGCLKVFGYKEK